MFTQDIDNEGLRQHKL